MESENVDFYPGSDYGSDNDDLQGDEDNQSYIGEDKSNDMWRNLGKKYSDGSHDKTQGGAKYEK